MEINWNGSTLFYEKSGSGAEKLLLFHGFGQDHSALTPLVNALSKDFTCYSFDLFFHGRSTFPEINFPILSQDWEKVLQLFLQKEDITQFNLLGYSIGSRFAITSLQSFPGHTRSITLIAPDGLTTNFWYSLATSNPLSRSVFRQMIKSNGGFQTLANVAQRTKIVSSGLLRFAVIQMGTAEKRQKVYNSWVAFRKLKAGKKFVQIINERNIPMLVYLAKHDQMIREDGLTKYLRQVKNLSTRIIDTGHNRLIDVVSRHISQDLKLQSGNQH
jgi:pimeloyl-ACP methyl ester carboxylesterase